MSDVAAFLATCPVFSGLSAAEIQDLASVFQTASHPAGTILLKQGGYSDAVYFLRSGRLAVRIQRGYERETVAMLQPPEAFGELSFITGKQCVADVEVVVDSEVVFLPREAMPPPGPQRDALMRGMLSAIATRLQVTMQRGAIAVEPPVVLIRNYPHWAAPNAFAGELVNSLARQTETRTVVVNIGVGQADKLVETGPLTAVINVGAEYGGVSGIRATVARHLDSLEGFHNVLLNIAGPESLVLADQIQDLANFRGYLLGPGDPIPETATVDPIPDFLVQSADAPTLPFLCGSRQLIHEESASEDAFRRGQPVTDRFRRIVDSMARRIAGTQVGIALGGGAAWGWSHIGALQVFEEAGLPIDMIAGSSMGSVIGSLYTSGRSTGELADIANYWNTRTKRFIEWRLWRMCLVSDRAVRKTFAGYFGDQAVNSTAMPFWANAVDIEKGEECAIRDGSLVECIRSSISLPGLLPPNTVPPRILVDAVIMNPVPAAVLLQMGCNYSVAINAMAAPGAGEMKARYPFNAFNVMTKCMFVVGHAMGQRAEPLANVVFTPDLNGITMLDFEKTDEIIGRGTRAAEAHLAAIMSGYQRLKDTAGKKPGGTGLDRASGIGR